MDPERGIPGPFVDLKHIHRIARMTVGCWALLMLLAAASMGYMYGSWNGRHAAAQSFERLCDIAENESVHDVSAVIEMQRRHVDRAIAAWRERAKGDDQAGRVARASLQGIHERTKP